MTSIDRIKDLAQIQQDRKQYVRQKAVSYGAFGGLSTGIFTYCVAKDLSSKSCSKLVQKLPKCLGLVGLIAGAIVAGTIGASDANKSYSKYLAKI